MSIPKPSEPVDVTLSGKKFFVDLLKFKAGIMLRIKSFWII